ncbi:MAG TPA: GDSL-type esterase/lipase family protein [Puia sp.]|jgi:lysophospholipase L1-like esterase|nr:GDSL-type esterase/lipase family protein [Puia sp.]
MSEKNSRRNFLKTAALGGMMATAIPEIVSAAMAKDGPSAKTPHAPSEPSKAKKIRLNDGDVVLFQGDSITDWHRKRDDDKPNSGGALGTGYPFFVTGELLCRWPGRDLKCYNRGVSGNKVYQLADRWQTDCLDLKPTVLSILVGVNDFWHTLVNGYKGTIKTYRDDYKTLLDRTKQALPDVRLIIGEPYAVIGVKAVDDKWYPAFNEYRAAAKEIAESFGAVFIPYQEIYDKAQRSAPGSYWTIDGVHPSLAGARLMAEAWVATIHG